MPPHGHHGRGARALQAGRRQAAGADEALDLAGAADAVAVFVVRVRRRVVRVLQAVGRGADADKQQAALEAPDDDGALAELDGDGDGPDGASGALLPVGRVLAAAAAASAV